MFWKSRVPAVIEVVRVYVLDPLRVVVPVPICLRAPAPEIVLATV